MLTLKELLQSRLARMHVLDQIRVGGHEYDDALHALYAIPDVILRQIVHGWSQKGGVWEIYLKSESEVDDES